MTIRAIAKKRREWSEQHIFSTSHFSYYAPQGHSKSPEKLEVVNYGEGTPKSTP